MKTVGQLSHDGIGRKTRVKFVISHWPVSDYDTSSSFSSVRSPALQRFVKIFCTNLKSPVWGRDVVVPPRDAEVGHGPKGIMVGRISESRTLFYRGHEINMAGF